MSSYSVLVVDDQPDNFDVIEALLPSQTYRLHYANCGEDAIVSLEKFDPDVILLDVMMPGIDGFQVCKRIKLMSQWQGVPIIMVTALSGKEDLARCLAAGADDFITKPVNGLELIARVSSMLRIKKQYDRIQAFSKLQRNNLHSLANNLNEIRLDLAVGFPNEFNLPLSTATDNITYLKQNVEHLNLQNILMLLNASESSLAQLHNLTRKFWLYLKLIVETPVPSTLDLSLPKSIIERLFSDRLVNLPISSNLTCEVEDTELAVSEDLAEWVFNELLDYLFKRYQDQFSIKVHGRIIDNAFHLSLSNHPYRENDNFQDITGFIQFTSHSDVNSELEIGLKIVKKIVEIYDGIFLISDADREDVEIYVTLPLVPKIESISELQLESATT